MFVPVIRNLEQFDDKDHKIQPKNQLQSIPDVEDTQQSDPIPIFH